MSASATLAAAVPDAAVPDAAGPMDSEPAAPASMANSSLATYPTPPLTGPLGADSSRLAMPVRNGRTRNSPIRLLVNDIGHHHQGTALQVLKRSLQNLKLPNLEPSMLQLTPVLAGPEDGGRPSCVRIPWSGNAWYTSRKRSIDLVAEMEVVLAHLSKFPVYWSCAPRTDRRCYGRFLLRPSDNSAPLSQEDAIAWAKAYTMKREGCRLTEITAVGFDYSAKAGHACGLHVVVNKPKTVKTLQGASRPRSRLSATTAWSSSPRTSSSPRRRQP